MRTHLLLVVIALVAGCRGGGERAASGSGSSAGSGSGALHVVTPPLPGVGARTRLAPISDPVPAHEILIDASGRIAAFAAATTWSGVDLEVDAKDPLTRDGLEELANRVHRTLKDAYDAKGDAEDAAADKAELARLIAEGQSEAEARDTMAQTHYEPEFRKLGAYLYADRPDSEIPATGDGRPVRDAVPVRVPKLTAIASDTFPPEPFVFVVARAARAHVLVDALVATSGGLIAVAAPDGVRALRLRFKHVAPGPAHVANTPWAPWIELRIGHGTIDVEAVPGTPVKLTGDVDPSTLHATIATLRAQRPALAADHTVDVLVEDDADVQDLVGVLAALDEESVTEIGLGRAPGAADGDAMRARPLTLIPIPAVELDPGEGGTVPVRELIVEHMAAIRACFANVPKPTPVIIHAKKDGTSRTVVPVLEGKPTPLARCVFAQLEAPFAHQDVAFKVRFARLE